MSQTGAVRHPLAWVPSAYIAEGIPFAIVIWVAGTMFKDLGHTDAEITIATASVGLAWSLKPLWAAFLDMSRTKKFWVLAMECTLAALLALLALVVRLPESFHLVIGGLWLLAFASATQDICVDGVYMSSLDDQRQAAYIGVQGTAWNVGRFFATALVVWVAGTLQSDAGFDPRRAWSLALLLSAIVLGLLALYHRVVLPVGSVPRPPRDAREVFATLGDSVGAFLRKKQLWGMLIFVFLYRSGEGFLLVEAPLFLQAPVDAGGAGLTLQQKGLIDGTISTTAGILGGLAGGAFIARRGLRQSLFTMALCMNIPHLCFVYLSHSIATHGALPLSNIALLVFIEKFGYSFGFTANMLYMMQQIAPGPYQMTHYAFCTALMNLVLIPTQMASGALADWLGYASFFMFVMLASIPSVIAAWFAPFPRPPSGGERTGSAPDARAPESLQPAA